ncbi:MAG TPA: NfeD family protein [Caldimonas sp.]|jgi:membrane protein implicated in regulation of membrane protease activity|nr:NfeD family protein [Caldimonas sp.]HEX2541527.1 NfeD family protein [Caldimonas sp.]
MDLSPATWWWIAAGIAVALELATGTFHLLMIALGLCAGAVAAHLGAGLPLQMLTAAAVGGGASALWRWQRRGQRHAELPAARNRDVNLDIGGRVHVAEWSADRTTQVQYRGSRWTARLQPGAAPLAGEHVVAGIEGNWLILAPSAD